MTSTIAIVAIAAIAIVGMFTGHDGTLRALSLTLIAGIGGFKLKGTKLDATLRTLASVYLGKGGR